MDAITADKVYATREYSKFKLVQGNRPESKSHIRSLIASFDRYPELARTRPVLVNDNFEIIDGQHRFQACISLGLPIYYTISAGVDISTARLLNANQRAWKLKDFLNSFVASGSDQYVKLQQLLEEYPIPLSTLIIYTAGHKNRSLRSQFRNGSFKLMKDKELMNKRLNALRDVAAYYKHWTDGSFAEAYFSVFANPEFDHERFVQKLKLTPFQRQSTTMDNMREIERVYNFNAKESANQRLF